ncbi:MAG: hypothetical protein J5851_00970, partial [Oscillospiraceae bacterium]|nr:hypothetical protein [Oscillospiraceae bacterium]
MTENLPYHLWESMLYDVLRTLPHMLLVLYAFRGHWRFGKTFTIVMTALLWVIEMILPQISDLVSGANSTVIDISEIVIY